MASHNKICFKYNSQNPSGCDYYRAILPARNLLPILQAQQIDSCIEGILRESDDLTAIMVHRVLDDAMIRHLLWRQQTQRFSIIWDTDDLLTEIPKWNPVHPHFKRQDLERYQAMAELADLATFSTKNLMNCTPTSVDCAVLPNLIDLMDWRGMVHHPSNEEKIRIIWCGSETHREDLLMIKPAIDQIIQDYGDRIKIIFFGYMPEEYHLTSICQISYMPPVPISQYIPTMIRLSPHIGLAPLIDCKFNSCKSNIKYLEYTASGAASVVSLGVGPYDQADGSVGLTGSNPEGWYKAIKALIEDHEFRRNCHAKAASYVHDNYTWQHSPYKQVWLDAFSNTILSKN